MIKNIIFDIGGVLTNFDPNDYLGAFGFSEEEAPKLSKAIFKNQHWKDYMVGLISPEDFKRNVIENNLELKDKIEYILAKENSYKMLPPLKEGVELLLSLKQKGYNIYVLSNIVKDSLDYFKSNFIEVLNSLSGAIYSCEVHLKKPDPKIYQLILDEYNLKADETMFLDDSKTNIASACELGIHGILFNPVIDKEVVEKVKKMLN